MKDKQLIEKVYTTPKQFAGCNLWNNKLYTQYYPLVTEEDKSNFLNVKSIEIVRIVRDISRDVENKLHARRYAYVKKMKPTVSFLGTLKYRNIAHNEFIENMMRMDRDIESVEKKMADLDSLYYNLIFHEYDNITVEDLNYILSLINIKKHKMWAQCLLLLVLVIVCVCISL